VKKIILCIIVSCLFSSQQLFSAQENTSFDLKTKDIDHMNKAYGKSIDIPLRRVSDDALLEINHNFYETEALYTIAFNNINYLPTTEHTNTSKTITSASFVTPNDSELITLQKPYIPFVVAIFLLLATIIAFIIVRRIRTNTLKLF